MAAGKIILVFDSGVGGLTVYRELAANFDLDFHFAQVDTIFARVFRKTS